MNVRLAVSCLAMGTILMLSGCASMNDMIAGDPWQAYEGPAQPRNNVAIIKTSGMRDYFSEAYIFRINDRAVEKIGGYIDTLPGHYTLEVSVTQRLGGPGSLLGTLSEKRARGTIDLDAEPGRTYIVDGRVADGKALLWIEDEKTQQVVAGTRP